MSTSKIVNTVTARPALPPVHIAFSPIEDVVASVFPSGEVTVRQVKTKLQKGPGRTLTPEEAKVTHLPEGVKPRQIAVRAEQVAVLGWHTEESRDAVWVAPIGSKDWRQVSLGGSGAGKLVGLEDHFVYQSKDGEISLGEFKPFPPFNSPSVLLVLLTRLSIHFAGLQLRKTTVTSCLTRSRRACRRSAPPFERRPTSRSPSSLRFPLSASCLRSRSRQKRHTWSRPTARRLDCRPTSSSTPPRRTTQSTRPST